MASVVPLKFTAKLICIQTLLDLSGDGDKEAAQRMLRQLQTGCFTAVSCGLLRRLVERYPGKVTNNVLSALASTHLRELKLKKCKSVSFAGLKNVLENCPLVTKLDLSECDQFSQPEVFHIASFLRPGITALSLENCLTVDNSVVQSILLYMKTLQHLNLSGCSKLTDNVFLLNENLQLQRETFGQMTQECYDCALISVDVSCTTLTSTAVRHLATLTGPTLKHVNISWTGADTLALLYLSGYGRPAILDLTLSDPDTVLDFPLELSLLELKNTLNKLKLGMLRKERAKNENKNLQKVKISWKDNLKSSMLEELAPLWPNVNYISLIDCESLTSQSLVTLATKCKQIQTLTLQGVTFIQDFAMIPFINNGCLESLNLAECRITDHTLTRMSKHKMEKMRELDLSWCDDTSSVGLDRLFGKTSDTLRKLSIRQLAANDKTLSLIASNFHLLTSLNMSSVDGITDDAVVNLVESIRTLEHVDFSWNLGVSNRSISALLKNCQRLQRADLAGLKTITSEPFLPLISNLRQWRRCQALLRLKLHERSVAAASADAGTSSDEEYTDIYMPHRSTVYGTDLTYLNLEFCDQVNDNHLAEICIVCRRESLTIFNYYGELVKPELFIGQGRQWYSNYIPAHDD
ncbi:F-box and leucine-rich repeat protein 13-like [Ylistrum balloti]|uniref:F-box and leucine-rich repeat protein 13-like n=1 Tax=Ylistrum balloti TaxID=509963 RepID=UPI002905E57C|nr:F-box and leucine-rich repeat protein 13-like [Ylistrum balloti]